MNKKRMSSLVLAAILSIAMALPVSADYTKPLSGNTSFELTKYIFMDQDAQVLPTVDFEFQIRPGEAVPGEKIQEGIGEITKQTAHFTDGDASHNYGTPEANGVPGLGSGQKFVEQKVTFDFSAVNFKEPGAYRYAIIETASDKAYITDDTNSEKTLDVYVVNNESGNGLKIDSYVLTNKGVSEKSKGYVNTYDTYDLAFETQIDGNQASVNQYFKYTVELSDTIDGEYMVTLSGAESGSFDAGDFGNVSNSTSITVTTTGTGTFYLKDGQTITISGLPKGTNYSIKQEEVEGYTLAPKEGYSGKLESDGSTLTFTNTKNGVIPTGVMLVVAPFAALMAVGGLGAFAIARKRRDDEE